jgi:5-methylcytosine-specific restriction endonuclease McrA
MNKGKTGAKGVSNGRWNGGTSEYPDHYWLKKQRKRVLENSDGRCEICGEVANVVHHKDGSKNNHYLRNLIALCYTCHGETHANMNRI